MPPGRTHTDEEVAARRADVRKAIGRGWSRKAAQRIADEHGVSLSQVMGSDKQVVMEQLKAEIAPERREQRIAEWHEQVNDLYQDSRDAKDRSAASKALALKAKALGVESPRRVELSGGLDINVSGPPPDGLLAMLAARVAALGKGGGEE